LILEERNTHFGVVMLLLEYNERGVCDEEAKQATKGFIYLLLHDVYELA
jgi:hypothetical protein